MSFVNIPGATGSNYTLVTADLTAQIRVVVTATNTAGSASANAAGVGPVTAAPDPPSNSAPPVISGSTVVGQTLTTTTGTWVGALSLAAQWKKDGVNISGATTVNYTLVTGDIGGIITVTVTATNTGGSTSATSTGVGPVTLAFARLKIGGGGVVSSVDMVADGTKVCRTDTAEAFLWDGAKWNSIVTVDSIPSTDNFPGMQGLGIYEIRIAPSDSNYLYMTFHGYVFTSTNKGTTWTRTSLAYDDGAYAGSNDSARTFQDKSAVDPQDRLTAIITRPSSGCYITHDGGSTWTALTGIATTTGVPGGAVGYYTVAFDRSSAVVGGKTQGIYLASYGTGVYHSTNGGTSWTLTTGTPTTMRAMEVASDGYVYLCSNGTGNGSQTTVYIYSGSGSWTTGSPGSAPNFYNSCTPDPATAGRVVAIDGDGNCSVSTNHGSTWTGINGHSLVNTNTPWALTTMGGSTAGVGLASGRFDPSVSNTICVGYGFGVVKVSPANTATSSTWTDMTPAIENLDGNWIVKPPGGNPVAVFWDMGVFTNATPSTYTSTSFPVTATTGLAAGWSVDYSPSTPATLVALINFPLWAPDSSGISTNGGASWTAFSTPPPNFSTDHCQRGGCIAINAGASVGAANIVIVGTGGASNPNTPYYTTNGGSTWTICSIPGTSSTSGEWGQNYYDPHQILCSDRVTAGVFYIYSNVNGVFKSTNGGANFTNVRATTFPGALGLFPQMSAVPSNAGHLFFTLGRQNATGTNQGVAFNKSQNGGSTWTTVPNVTDIWRFGFGKAVAGGYPAMYIVGFVSGVFGIYRSDNADQATPSWTMIGDFPVRSIDDITCITGDPDTYGKVYGTFKGSGAFYTT